MESLFDKKIKKSLKCFVDVMYSITEFKRRVSLSSVKVLSPYNNMWVYASSFMHRRFRLTILKLEQCRSYRLVDSIALPQLQIRLSESQKL